MNNSFTIGKFKVTSDKVRISDPCYDLDTWCAGTVNKVKDGDWEAYVVKSDNRCAVLVAHHKDHKIKNNDHKFRKQSINIGVDSGQAGIFDLKYFKDDKVVAKVKRQCKNSICEDEPWYSICCDRTLGKVGAGVIPFGCVSSSGYGDGSYIYSTAKIKGKVVAIKINFGIIEEEKF